MPVSLSQPTRIRTKGRPAGTARFAQTETELLWCANSVAVAQAVALFVRFGPVLHPTRFACLLLCCFAQSLARALRCSGACPSTNSFALPDKTTSQLHANMSGVSVLCSKAPRGSGQGKGQRPGWACHRGQPAWTSATKRFEGTQDSAKRSQSIEIRFAIGRSGYLGPRRCRLRSRIRCGTIETRAAGAGQELP